MSDKAKFVDDFITTFLATWTANHYEAFCQRGWDRYPKTLPVEDAGQLADDAWTALHGDSPKNDEDDPHPGYDCGGTCEIHRLRS